MDITSGNHQGDLFSTQAHDSVLSSKNKLRAMVIMTIRDNEWYGCTSDEIEQLLELSHQTVSARMTELKALGQIFLKGSRKTRSGRSAGVWVTKEYR